MNCFSSKKKLLLLLQLTLKPLLHQQLRSNYYLTTVTGTAAAAAQSSSSKTVFGWKFQRNFSKKTREKMWRDLFLQGAIFVITVLMFLFSQNIPQKLLSKLRLHRRRSHLEAKRHFVLGAQLLSESPSAAEAEADRAIALDPTDAASHILKALALDLQGFRTSALASLDAALSPLAARTLTDCERADALFKRAELRAVGGEEGAVEDLVESVRLKGFNAEAYSLLGRCYQKKGLLAPARDAFQNALRVLPDYASARDALARLDQTNP